MASAVKKLQQDILEGTKELTICLRTAKVIAAKLNLDDLSSWIDLELKGYPRNKDVPEFRKVVTAHIEVQHPYSGWQLVAYHSQKFPVWEPINTLEGFSKSDGNLMLKPPKKLHITDITGDSSLASSFPQRFIVQPSEFKRIVEAVRDELLNWTIELEKRGIKGEDMDFNEKEKKAAVKQIFNIQNFHGVAGNVENSQVAVYDYSTIHQTLKEAGVPQNLRNQMEDIMDELKAKPDQKQTLLQKAKKLIIENKDVLGSSLHIVCKAFGFSIDALEDKV